MDRREALRKLGVGGTIAVGAPMIVSSFAVAQTASPGVPETPLPDGDDSWVQPRSTTTGYYTFTPPADAVTCTGDGSAATPSFEIENVWFNAGIAGAGELEVTPRTNDVLILGADGSRLLGTSLFLMRFTVDIRVTWHCGEESESASYQVIKDFVGRPTVPRVSRLGP